MDNKFLIEKWVNHRPFLVYEKNFQKFDLTVEVLLV